LKSEWGKNLLGERAYEEWGNWDEMGIIIRDRLEKLAVGRQAVEPL
jgi:hypothetical protein